MQQCFYSIGLTFTMRHIHNWALFLLWLSLFILLELFVQVPPVAYWALTNLKGSSFSVISFVFSYCSRGSWGKNAEMVCYCLFQCTTFCQNSPPWPVHLVWSCMEWFIISLNYTRLWSMWSILANFLLLWFSFCLSSDGWGWETCGNFLMWGTACGENWVLLCWAGRCSLNLQPNCLLMGVAVPPPSSLAWDGPVLEPAVSMVGWQALWQG